MYSDPFDVLGLDRLTATDADIRKAYAARLKVTRPEEDREGFIALREAFERAREFLKWRDVPEYPEEDDGEDDIDAPEQDGEHAPELILTEDQTPPEPRRGHVYPYATQPDLEFHPGVYTLVDAFESTADKSRLSEIAAGILELPEYFGVDESAALSASLLNFLCLKTGIEDGTNIPAIHTQRWINWADLWQFDTKFAQRQWPEWLTVDLLQTLNQNFYWTYSQENKKLEDLKRDWIAQVILELQCETLPRSEALFQRLSSAIGHYRRGWPANRLVNILDAHPPGTDEEEAELKARLRSFLLDSTNFGVRAIVGTPPDWMTIDFYIAVERRFRWNVVDKAKRRKIDREKMILQNLGRKRDKNVPTEIREAAWLEVLKEELFWKTRPPSERSRHINAQYGQERIGQEMLLAAGLVPFLIVLFLIAYMVMNIIHRSRMY